MSAETALVRTAGPEFELMCLSAHLEIGDQEIVRIRALLSGKVDWVAWLATVERNYVAPVIYRNLHSIEGLGIPPKVLDTLRVRSKITALKSELFTTELLRLYGIFESRSIQTLNYKGAVTAAEFYGSIALRNFNDLDFLVRRNDLAPLIEALEAEGYRNSEVLTPTEFDRFVTEFKEFLFTRGDISLEPHWSLTARRYPFETDYEGFWRRSRMLMLRGVQLRVMCAEDSLLVLCLVGAKGKWKRLQMVSDVAACLRKYPNLEWARIAAMAAETGTVRILHLALLLAMELAGAPLPESLASVVRRTASVRKLARAIVAALAVKPAAPGFLPDSAAIFSPLLFAQRERYRDRLRYLWHTMTTPAPLHMRRLPLPKVAYPVYRIFVPLHDFVIYPAWQLVKSAIKRERGLTPSGTARARKVEQKIGTLQQP